MQVHKHIADGRAIPSLYPAENRLLSFSCRRESVVDYCFDGGTHGV